MRALTIARVLSIVCGAWWTFFGLASGIGEGIGLLGTIIHTLVPGLVILATAIAAWRWRLAGGVLLVLEGLLALWFFGYLSSRLLTLAGLSAVLMLALPPVVSGVLFILGGLGTRARRLRDANSPTERTRSAPGSSIHLGGRGTQGR